MNRKNVFLTNIFLLLSLTFFFVGSAISAEEVKFSRVDALTTLPIPRATFVPGYSPGKGEKTKTLNFNLPLADCKVYRVNGYDRL